MRIRCPSCGYKAHRSHLKRHQGGRPCRGRQVQKHMKELGLVMVKCLTWQKVLQWAEVPFDRRPAAASGNTYRRPRKYRKLVKSTPDFSDPIYEGLSDALFVPLWVSLLLKGRSAYQKKDAHKQLVQALRGIQQRDDEFKKALMTTHALGGDQALNILLVTEGLWNSQKS